MLNIEGKFASAVVFADEIEESARAQIGLLLDQPFAEGCRVRIMPDVHAGAGCVIGFTADLGDKVVPNLVGVDIGCGMLTVALGKRKVDFAALDGLIRAEIPAGTAVHEGRKARFPLEELRMFRELKDSRRLERSLGTLGGGNHFIEVDADGEGALYLIIHTGSRNLGKQVAERYQTLAVDLASGKGELFAARRELIAKFKAEGRRAEIQPALKALEASFTARQPSTPKDLCFLTGPDREDYLHDMALCQVFAVRNRALIADTLLKGLFGEELADFDRFETVHNYIDLTDRIVRKGAVSARTGERLLIPINMRDGSLLCEGLGNPDWNCSAPHGAGRLCSRAEARTRFTVEAFRESMAGIFTTSVGEETLDECPMAYKSMDHILKNLGPTAAVKAVLRPRYNFKAGQ